MPGLNDLRGRESPISLICHWASVAHA
jgi:hypothetical protein